MNFKARLSVTCVILWCCCAAGCVFNTHGNRADDRRLITRATDLRRVVNQRVTLVGTARAGGPADSRVDLRGGSVELPAYEWPAGYVDQPESVTGTLFEDRAGDQRVYRLGEVEAASRWGR